MVELLILSWKILCFTEYISIMPASEVFEVLIPVAVILGIGIGLIGSFFAVRKHADE